MFQTLYTQPMTLWASALRKLANLILQVLVHSMYHPIIPHHAAPQLPAFVGKNFLDHAPIFQGSLKLFIRVPTNQAQLSTTFTWNVASNIFHFHILHDWWPSPRKWYNPTFLIARSFTYTRRKEPLFMYSLCTFTFPSGHLTSPKQNESHPAVDTP